MHNPSSISWCLYHTGGPYIVLYEREPLIKKSKTEKQIPDLYEYFQFPERVSPAFCEGGKNMG